MSILRLLIGGLVVASATGATVWWRTRGAPTLPVADYPRQLDLGPQKFQDIVDGPFRVSNTGGSPVEPVLHELLLRRRGGFRRRSLAGGRFRPAPAFD